MKRGAGEISGLAEHGKETDQDSGATGSDIWARPAEPVDEQQLNGERKAGRLGDLLVERGLITQSQLGEALLQQPASGKPLGSLLVELGALDELALARVLAEQLGVPLADLRKDAPDDAAITILPESVARAHTAIPIRKTDSGLEVAMPDPLDRAAIAEISEAAKTNVIGFIAPASDIRRAIDKAYRAITAVERHVEAFLATEAITNRVLEEQDVAEHAPVVKVVNLVITQAVRDRASDIHIEPQDSRVRVRYRIDGALHDVLALPPKMGPAVVSRVKVLAGMNIVERRRPQDGKIAMEVDGRDIDLRVATATTIWGEKAVMRLLDKSRSLFRLDELGMEEESRPTTPRAAGRSLRM